MILKTAQIKNQELILILIIFNQRFMIDNNLILFPVKIKHVKKFIEQSEITNILLEIKKHTHVNHNSLIGKANSTHKFFTNFLKNSKIEKKLNNMIKEYCKIIGVNNQIIYNCWTNIQKKDSKLIKHSHADSPVSGVLYLQVDDKSSKIYFYNPNPYIHVMNIKNNNETNFEYVYFKPEVGDLIIFPGWLLHGSNEETNKSKERIALSFNTTDEIT